MSAVDKSVVANSSVAPTSVQSPAIVKAIVKMLEVDLVSSHVERLRRHAVIQTKPSAMLRLLAKKTRPVLTRSSSLVSVKLRNRRCDAMRPRPVRVT